MEKYEREQQCEREWMFKSDWRVLKDKEYNRKKRYCSYSVVKSSDVVNLRWWIQDVKMIDFCLEGFSSFNDKKLNEKILSKSIILSE